MPRAKTEQKIQKDSAAKVAPMRRPKQARSLETVERILSAAMEIINSEGVEALTTNKIAAQAGLSVASLYQFFPNKLAVVNELYTRWLAEIDARVEAALEAHTHTRSWREPVQAIAGELGRFTLTSRGELELIRAMWSHRDLLELDRRRNRALAAKVAAAMSRFAPERPRPELERLAAFANEIFTLVAYLDGGADPSERDHLNALAAAAFMALWRGAMSPKG